MASSWSPSTAPAQDQTGTWTPRFFAAYGDGVYGEGLYGGPNPGPIPDDQQTVPSWSPSPSIPTVPEWVRT